MEKTYQLYRYRWVVLGVFMLINVTIQLTWATFGGILKPAADFYGVTDNKIGLLSMLFMIIFVPLSLPVSWLIDKWGFRKAVGLGAVLMGVFALLRGVFGESYPAGLLCTIGLAIAQPFMLNSWTTVAAKWFPLQERATAVAAASIGSFIGTGIGFALTPMLMQQIGIPKTLLYYGIVTAISAVLFVVLAREEPPTPPSSREQIGHALMLDGIKQMLKNPNFVLLMMAFFVGNGIFNGLSTWLEGIVRPRGINPEQAGILGALLIVGGVIGAASLPAWSDKTRRRKPFLVAATLLAVPAFLGLIFFKNYGALMAVFAVYGFFSVAISPIGFQYAAEITAPAPEGTSNGLLFLVGQVSVVFVYGMQALRSAEDGSFTLPLLILAGFSVVMGLLLLKLKESTLLAKV